MIGKGKGRSGSGLLATIPPGVSAGAGAREYVAMGALTGGEEVQFPKRSGNPLERGDKEVSSDGTKGTAGAPTPNTDVSGLPATRRARYRSGLPSAFPRALTGGNQAGGPLYPDWFSRTKASKFSNRLSNEPCRASARGEFVGTNGIVSRGVRPC